MKGLGEDTNRGHLVDLRTYKTVRSEYVDVCESVTPSDDRQGVGDGGEIGEEESHISDGSFLILRVERNVILHR